ncbi:MAG TPA: hypothetical protein VM934_05335 [Pyrinomonadaceae bacterium]|jgi:hypothetical protein|nr:hypothetical protein [Pyrinomonadaceae bacterium]
METKLEKEVRLLKAYAVAATLLCAVFVFAAFTQANRKQKFEEIDVERINIVEKDGRLRFVFTNEARMPDARAAGKDLTRDKTHGIFFYNDDGDEAGGLVFSNKKKADGGYEASGGLTIDQYQQDQTVGLQYIDSNGTRRAGLVVWDRPTMSLPEQIERLEAARKMKDGPEKQAELKALRGAARVYVGRSRDDGASAVQLYDASGKLRLRMEVSADGVPKLEFLDANGKVIQTLPETSGATKK